MGKPHVTDVQPCNGVTAECVVENAAIAERPSEHPLGKAILQKAKVMSLMVAEPEKFQYTPGKGIACAVNGEKIIVGNRAFLEEQRLEVGTFASSSNHSSEVLVAHNNRLLGSLHIEDTLRPEAVEAVKAMRNMGLRTILLTGDVATIANYVGKQLGVDEVYGDLLPDDKVGRLNTNRANSPTIRRWQHPVG
jgi:Cu+-exporting ATPase